jgi:hypothetical protein
VAFIQYGLEIKRLTAEREEMTGFPVVLPWIFLLVSNRPGEPLMAKDVNAPKVGEEAPDFTAKSHLDTDVKLSSFRGSKNVVLAFYPMAFTPV